MKEGALRGIEECKNQFKDEIWKFELDGLPVNKELPIFVNTTLPSGKAICLSACAVSTYSVIARS